MRHFKMLARCAPLLLGCFANVASAQKPSPAFEAWTLVVAEDAIASETYAAEEFQRFFTEATGFDLPVSREQAGTTNNLFIGPGDALAGSALGHAMKETYGSEEIRIVVADGNVAPSWADGPAEPCTPSTPSWRTGSASGS